MWCNRSLPYSEYRDVTIELMTDVASLDTFPNLVKQVDADALPAEARAAVASLAKWVERHAGLVEERERPAADLAAHQEEVHRNRSFTQVLQELTQEFLRLRGVPIRRVSAAAVRVGIVPNHVVSRKLCQDRWS